LPLRGGGLLIPLKPGILPGMNFLSGGAMGRVFRTFAAGLAISLLIISRGGCSTNPLKLSADVKNATPSSKSDFDRMRAQMVQDQVRARNVRDGRVLAAMLKVPRHEFVPAEIISSAYVDNALPLMLGQTISQPYIVGYMTEALELTGAKRVLEIGTGSGYQTAILAEIVPEVYTIEIHKELTDYARNILGRLGYENIHFRTGDGYLGWPEFAPFDRIMVTAAPDHIPQPLIDQLSPSGRMIIPIGRMEQDLVIVRKDASGISSRAILPVRFVPMTGLAQEVGPY
jgi:protein-L-isoaspartate(D-aspartate) O-methyltransferase